MKTQTANPRQKLVRLLHVAKRDLRLDDDTYRGILRKIGNKESSSEMTVPELEKTLQHMKRCGFKVRSKRGASGQNKPPASRALADDPESKKIRALWLFLHDLGLVKNPAEAALATYAKRLTGVDALQWLNGRQTETVIESLKKWAMRILPGQVKAMGKKVTEAINSGERQLTHEEIEALNYVYARAQKYPSFDPMQAAWYSLVNILEKGKSHEREQ